MIMDCSPELNRPLRTIEQVVAHLAERREHALRHADRAYEERLSRQMDTLMSVHRARQQGAAR